MHKIVDFKVIKNAREDIKNMYRNMAKIKEDYIEIVRSHHNVMKDYSVTYDYKIDDFNRSLEEISQLKSSYLESAFEELNTIEKKYSRLSALAELFEDASLRIMNLAGYKESIFIMGEDGEVEITRSIEGDLKNVAPTLPFKI